MRDNIKHTAYYEYIRLFCEKNISECENDILTENDNIPYWSRVYNLLLESQMDLIFVKYSMGESKADIRPLVYNAIKNYCIAENLNDDPDYDKKDLFCDYIGVFENGLFLLSLSILFDVEKTQIIELKTTFEKTKGKDMIIDTILNFMFDDLKISTKSTFQKQYGAILTLLHSTEENKKIEMKNYLSNWYSTKRSTNWYNSDKKAKMGGPTAYRGYWSLEAAALCKLLKINKEEFKNELYFPYYLI